MEQPCPASRVFSIPELLESILQHLSAKDLLLSQRTSRTFRYTVEGSTRLRRKLFLEPDWNPRGSVFDTCASSSRRGQKPENNRLLLRAFPGYYPTVTLVVVNDGKGQQDNRGKEEQQMTLSRDLRSVNEHWSWDVCISFPSDRKPDCHPAAEYPEASWRKMYLSQPPCTDLYLVRRWQRGLRPAIIREEGITMGDLFEEATRETPRCGEREWHSSYISSDKDWHFEGAIQCGAVAE